MTAATVSPTLSQLYTVLGDFIKSVLGLNAGQVFQGYPNRTAMPPSAAAGYVVMSAMTKRRLRTNVDTWVSGPDPTEMSAEQGQQIDIQIDCYSPISSDWSDILTTLLRDEYGCIALAGAGNYPDNPICQPLYADDPIRAPLVNGEEQYEDRWIVTARIQYNPVTVTPQQFADTLGPVDIIDVEVSYPL